MVVASFQTAPGLDVNYAKYVSFTPYDRSFSGQAGIQVAGSFISLGIAVAFGLLAGGIISIFYDFHNSEFFDDKHYFEVP